MGTYVIRLRNNIQCYWTLFNNYIMRTKYRQTRNKCIDLLHYLIIPILIVRFLFIILVFFFPYIVSFNYTISYIILHNNIILSLLMPKQLKT